MSTGFVFPQFRLRFFDHVTGAPLAFGQLFFYQAGSSTPQQVFQDQGLTTPWASPAVLDANGEITVYAPDSTFYKINLLDQNGVQQTGYPVDNVSIPSPTAGTAASPVPSGFFGPFAGTAAPTGWLMCDGSAVSRTTYAALFAAIGTTYGAGDGSTTFNLPDMRQRFPLGKASSGTGNTLGASGGSIDHVHTGDVHTHSVVVPHGDGWGSTLSTPGTTGRLQTGNSGGTGPDASEYMATTDQTLTSAQNPNTGGIGNANTGSNNPPYLVANYIIKQ